MYKTKEFRKKLIEVMRSGYRHRSKKEYELAFEDFAKAIILYKRVPESSRVRQRINGMLKEMSIIIAKLKK